MHTDGRLTLRTGGKGRKNQAAHSVLHIGGSLCSSEAFRTTMLFPSQESRIGVNTRLLSEDSTKDATLGEPNICITERANQFT